MEHLDKKKKITIMLAIMAAMLFAALNQTIIGTALPKIIAHLGGMEYFNWVFTIYMLASSVTAILVGKLSDMYGRKPFILIGISIFSIGSLFAGLSNTIIQLIIFRAVQGFGGGLIMSTAFTSVGDLFPPRERGRWQGLMSSVFALASILGPTLGGYIVDHWNWQWVFWVFLPVGIVAFILILRLFPHVRADDTEKQRVDYYGSIFLTLTMVPMLLGFSWAGTKYAWSSFEILSLFIGSFIALLLFIVVEKHAQNPVLPLHLFKNSIFTISNVVGFMLGVGMFGAIMYVPFFVQGVVGISATASGFIMMPMTLSMVIASNIGGQLISRTGKYKALAMIGLVILSTGLFLLSLMDIQSSRLAITGRMIVTGAGLGLCFPIFTITIQNAVEHRLLGVATASVQLFRQLGGTIGVAVMGTIMNAKMMSRLQTRDDASEEMAQLSPEVLDHLQSPQILVDAEQISEIQSTLSMESIPVFQYVLDTLREALSHSLTSVFLLATVVVAMAFLITIFLKEIPLRTTNEPIVEEDDESLKTVN